MSASQHQNATKYNVLLGISDEPMRTWLGSWFKDFAADWAIVRGATGSAEQCRNLAMQDNPYPDVLLLEENLSGNVFPLAYDLSKERPWLSMVLLTNGVTQNDPEAIRKALHVGFTGRTPLPATPATSEAARSFRALIEDLGHAARERRKVWETPEAHTSAATGARVIVVYGPKGGVGRTVIAAKLATLLADSARNSATRKVALCELSATAGDLAALLDVPATAVETEPIRTAAQYGGSLTAGNVETLMPACLQRTNLYRLFAPQPGTPQLTANDATEVIFGLRPHFHYMVIDTSAGFSAVTNAALSLATRHVLVTTPDHLSIEATRHGFEDAQALPASSDIPVDLIINRYPRSSAMPVYTTDQIREHVGVKNAPYIIDDQPDSMRYALDSNSLLVGHEAGALSFTQILSQISAQIVDESTTSTTTGQPHSSLPR